MSKLSPIYWWKSPCPRELHGYHNVTASLHQTHKCIFSSNSQCEKWTSEKLLEPFPWFYDVSTEVVCGSLSHLVHCTCWRWPPCRRSPPRHSSCRNTSAQHGLATKERESEKWVMSTNPKNNPFQLISTRTQTHTHTHTSPTSKNSVCVTLTPSLSLHTTVHSADL